MSETAPRLSIIVVTWNVADLIENCLNAVASTAQVSHEIIVVDNASTDGSADVVARKFPQVNLIRNRVNVGFPHANNQALPHVRGEHLLYLNPDTVVGPTTIPACVEELDRMPDVGMVGCRLDLADGTIQYEGGRRTYRLRHLLYEALYLHMIFPRSRVFGDQNLSWWDHKDSRDVEALAGAFMLVRSALARQVGGLPEDLFMYHEDLSFCLRIHRLGWRVRYRGDVGTLHLSGQSSSRSNLRLDLLKSECRFLLIKESDGAAAALVARLIWAFAGVLRLVAAAFGPLLPGLVRKYPRVFYARTHAYQILWSLTPGLLAKWMPRAPVGPGRTSAIGVL